MNFADLKDAHVNEDMIVVGNGPSLRNIPIGFLDSRPTVVTNFFRPHMPDWFKPTYWTCLDDPPMSLIPKLPGIIKLVPLKHQNKVEAANLVKHLDETVFYLLDDEVPGFVHHESSGMTYSTSIASAAHLAYYMGAKRIFVVGFDCTTGHKASSVNDRHSGRTDSVHFYDEGNKTHQYRPVWDSQMKSLLDYFVTQKGTIMYNLSKPTAARKIPIGNYRTFWSPLEKHDELYD